MNKVDTLALHSTATLVVDSASNAVLWVLSGLVVLHSGTMFLVLVEFLPGLVQLTDAAVEVMELQELPG